MNRDEIWYREEDLIYMKWNDTFCCVKCGINNYRVVNVTSRRCKECGTEESLFKYTAFERVRVPFDKIQELLLTIRDATERIIDGGIVNKNETVNKYINDSLENEEKRYKKHLEKNQGKSEKKTFKRFNHERVINRAINKQRSSLRDLSKQISIEENTVSLLLRKINHRIPLEQVEECETPSKRLELYFDYKYKSGNSYGCLMNLLMLPLVGNWSDGKCTEQKDVYIEEYRAEWNFYHKNEEFQYGDDIWKKLFTQRTEAR